MLASFVAVACLITCADPVEPVLPRPAAPVGPALAPPVPTDSLCRRLSFTFSGSNSIAVTFPNRASCTSGLVIIPGGTATRSGGGAKNANIPIRLLNRSAYAIRSPGTAVLAPTDRVILAPSGQSASKLTPQNQDSLRAGSWVWLVGGAGTVPLNDSTAARTLVLKLDSPATSAQVTFTLEAQLLSSGGWPLLTVTGPMIDATKIVTQPGSGVEVFRTAALLTFKEGVSDAAKQSFFSQNGLAVAGVTVEGLFYVTFADPGTAYSAYATVLAALQVHPDVKAITPAYRDLPPSDAARFPSDSVTRNGWLYGNAATQSWLWAARAIRLPQAWGCETGTYGGALPSVGILEWMHQSNHPEFASSSPLPWAPADDAALVSAIAPVSQAKRDTALRHAVATSGLLAAAGDNGTGIAGVAWKTGLQQFALRSPGGRSIVTLDFQRFSSAVRAYRPRILSVSVDVSNPDPSASMRALRIGQYKDLLRQLLDSVPDMTVIVAAGNEKVYTSVSNYATLQNAGVFRAALLELRTDALYSARIIIVAGTKPGNQFWDVNPANSNEGSNSFAGVTDIAAPAQDVLVLDTLKGTQVPIHSANGTSLSAPLVAGAASLLLTLDPSLTPTQVKDYLIRGAQVSRFDSTTGIVTGPNPVAGVPNATVYQLDVYGSLSLLSKERPGTPICGYSVSSGGPWNTHIRFERNGPLQPATDSILVPKAGHPLGVISVAQGGRVLSAYTGIDSLNNMDQSVIHFSHLGQRLGATTNYWGARHYLDKNFIDHRRIASWENVTLRKLDGTVQADIPQLKLSDGTVPIILPWWLDASPDGRFVAFMGGGAGTYVQRFSDLTSTRIGDAGIPRWSKDGTKLVVFGSDTLLNMTFKTYRVDSTASGGFTLLASASGSGRQLWQQARFSGDDAVFYTMEVESNPLIRYYVAARAATALGVKGSEALAPWSEQRAIGNVAAREPGNR